MGVNVTIQAADLKAVSLAMGKKDARGYLNGACLEIGADSLIWLVATDGNRLHAVVIGWADNAEPEAHIIPRDTVLAAVKAAGKTGEIAVSADALEVDITVGGATFKATPFDGKYPDWRRVVPDLASPTREAAPGQFDPAHLMDLNRAAVALGNREGLVHLAQGGERESALATVLGAPHFLGVVMPRVLRAAPETGEGTAYAAIRGAYTGD